MPAEPWLKIGVPSKRQGGQHLLLHKDSRSIPLPWSQSLRLVLEPKGSPSENSDNVTVYGEVKNWQNQWLALLGIFLGALYV